MSEIKQLAKTTLTLQHEKKLMDQKVDVVGLIGVN